MELRALPPSMRSPAWRWALVMSAALDRTLKLTSMQGDRLVASWASWYRGYLDHGTRLDGLEARTHALYATSRPYARRWMVEALLACGEEDEAIADRFVDMSPVEAARYADMFFDVRRLAKSRHEILNACLAWCSSAEWDLPWKLFAIENGAEAFMDMAGSSMLSDGNARWFRGVLKKRVAMAAAAHNGRGAWNEDVERLITSAGKWLEPPKDQEVETDQPKLLDWLGRLTIRLRDHTEEYGARETVPIPPKEDKAPDVRRGGERATERSQ
jgi:hypothetical protein